MQPNDPPTPTHQPSTGGNGRAVPARPPFAFSMAAPAGWEALRGDAGALRDDLLAVVARTGLWDRMTERQRAGTAVILDQVAAASAATGTVATMLRTRARDGGEPFVATITVTWFRTAPVLADLALAARMADVPAAAGGPVPVDGPVFDPDAGYDVVPSGVGPALVTRFVADAPTGTPTVTSQLYAPVPDSIGMAVVTGLTAREEDAEEMDGAVLAVGASFTVDRRAG